MSDVVERKAPVLKDGEITERLSQFRMRWQEGGDLLYLGKTLVDAITEITALRAELAAAKERARVADEAREAHAKCTAALIDAAEASVAAAEAKAEGLAKALEGILRVRPITKLAGRYVIEMETIATEALAAYRTDKENGHE
jgi:hypothetical protein